MKVLGLNFIKCNSWYEVEFGNTKITLCYNPTDHNKGWMASMHGYSSYYMTSKKSAIIEVIDMYCKHKKKLMHTAKTNYEKICDEMESFDNDLQCSPNELVSTLCIKDILE